MTLILLLIIIVLLIDAAKPVSFGNILKLTAGALATLAIVLAFA